MNELHIIGNITHDVELRQTQAGKSVCNFTVAVNRRKSGTTEQSEADFFNVTAWDKLAEICAQYLAKGRKVAVNGPVSLNTYTKRDGTTGASLSVLARDVEFLSPYGEQNGAAKGYAGLGGAARAANTASSAANSVNTAVESDEMPF